MLNFDSRSIVSAAFLLLGGILLFAGCSSPDPSQAKSSGGPVSSSAGEGDAWKANLSEDVVQALSELPEADRSAALAQKTCPVTDGPLGSMGKPVKVTIEGRDVYLCCDGCEKELNSHPEKYLAKINTPN
ncbi:MAG: hypothetical protein KDA90_21590 [Planctomycetaceae bacterium]|nr:hypothetical protein [Planctomycetaceae bacterium]